jgi:ABC-type bacteriocin/lantibiotic exporter with double-glycine peptidase domain
VGRYGARWYRIQKMLAGSAIQRLYLAAALPGLGCHTSLAYSIAGVNRLPGLAGRIPEVAESLQSPFERKEVSVVSGNSAAIISIENVHKSYERLKALDGVSLQICSGECFGLLGPNGAGKTTLLSCIEGLISFQEGRITVNGYDVARIHEK